MQLLPFLLGTLLGAVAVWLFVQNQLTKLTEESKSLRKEQGRLRHELQETEKCGSGLERFTERNTARKELAKGKILTALKAKTHLKNEEIAELAEVSAATVVRYMNELENEGKVQQVGKTGKNVVYRLNTSNSG